jgi:hypothetical protein
VTTLASFRVLLTDAFDPHTETTVRPYVAEDLNKLDISVPGVTTIEPSRTLWDKIIVIHGLRRWYEIRGEIRWPSWFSASPA